MKDRAGGDRGFLRALGAHPQALAGAPSTPAAAFRAGESIRPSKLREVFAAGGVVGEPGLELLKGAGVVNPTDGTRRRWRWHGSDSTALKQICRTYVRAMTSTASPPRPAGSRVETDLGWAVGRLLGRPLSSHTDEELADRLQPKQRQGARDRAEEAELILALAGQRPAWQDPSAERPGARRPGWTPEAASGEV